QPQRSQSTQRERRNQLLPDLGVLGGSTGFLLFGRWFLGRLLVEFHFIAVLQALSTGGDNQRFFQFFVPFLLGIRKGDDLDHAVEPIAVAHGRFEPACFADLFLLAVLVRARLDVLGDDDDRRVLIFQETVLGDGETGFAL